MPTRCVVRIVYAAFLSYEYRTYIYLCLFAAIPFIDTFTAVNFVCIMCIYRGAPSHFLGNKISIIHIYTELCPMFMNKNKNKNVCSFSDTSNGIMIIIIITRATTLRVFHHRIYSRLQYFLLLRERHLIKMEITRSV